MRQSSLLSFIIWLLFVRFAMRAITPDEGRKAAVLWATQSDTPTSEKELRTYALLVRAFGIVAAGTVLPMGILAFFVGSGADAPNEVVPGLTVFLVTTALWALVAGVLLHYERSRAVRPDSVSEAEFTEAQTAIVRLRQRGRVLMRTGYGLLVLAYVLLWAASV